MAAGDVALIEVRTPRSEYSIGVDQNNAFWT